MTKQTSHTKTKTTSKLSGLSKLSRLAPLIAVLVMFLPLLFLSSHIIVFSVFLGIVTLILFFILRDNYSGNTKLQHSILISICLGVAAGLFQLAAIPLVCLVFLSIFTVVGLRWSYQLILGLMFFSSIVLSYFVGVQFLGLTRIKNIVVDITAIYALFFVASSKYLFLHAKYQAVYDRLSRSQTRFNHFMKVANKLARYTPSQVWSAIVKDNKEVKLENKRRKLTVFFSDIKGFTDLSESLSAEDLTDFLNTYFDSMASIAKRHGGTIDKFIGDALMVFFGDPDSKGEREDALACLEMAVDMRRELGRLRSHWVALGFEGLEVRMGINTGYCHVGNFGSPSRLSYTAIGREVNLAARIQSAAQPNEILISQNTYELIYHNYRCMKGLPVVLKGIADPVDVWSVEAIRQGEDQRQMRWVEHDLPGFNLHINMREIAANDKVKIRQYLREATLTLDERIKHED